MNPDFLAPLSWSLRLLGEYAESHDVSDSTLASIAAELDKARGLVGSARGNQPANHCVRHPRGPVDPTAENGCLLCGAAQPRRVLPVVGDVDPADVLACLCEQGREAAAERYGPRAVTRALATGAGDPCPQQPQQPEQPDEIKGDTP